MAEFLVGTALLFCVQVSSGERTEEKSTMVFLELDHSSRNTCVISYILIWGINLIDGTVKADLMIKLEAGWILLKYALKDSLLALTSLLAAAHSWATLM